MSIVEKRLAELGIILPETTKPNFLTFRSTRPAISSILRASTAVSTAS
ncbi:hypothetical protein FHS15_003951 [Paenibacillus castaneae]|nr:hypothetical protein [Paenibacillus castaneae]